MTDADVDLPRTIDFYNRKLGQHLEALIAPPDERWSKGGFWGSRRLLRDVQRHVDALVAAGALELHGADTDTKGNVLRQRYAIPVPHVHGPWEVLSVTGDFVSIRCPGCCKAVRVPNFLPLEVPA